MRTVLIMKIFGRILYLFQFQCVSCTKYKISITLLVFLKKRISRDGLLLLFVYTYGKGRRNPKNVMLHCTSASFTNLVASLWLYLFACNRIVFQYYIGSVRSKTISAGHTPRFGPSQRLGPFSNHCTSRPL